MILLALDPSRTCTGYAVMSGPEPADLVECGRLTPSLARSQLAGMPAWLQDHLSLKPLTALRAVHSLVADVEALIAEHAPHVIVIEVPSGKVGTGAKRGARGSLTTYGFAAGQIYEACRRAHAAARGEGWGESRGEAGASGSGGVVPITERQWTAGRGGKDKRLSQLAGLYAGRYDPAQDPGGDAGDAIDLGRWWLLRALACGLSPPA